MIKKNVLLPSIIGLLSSASFFAIGIIIGKKIYSPKIYSGEIFIDYTNDLKHPNIYLNNLDTKIFSNNAKFIILGLNHVRK